MPKFRPIFVAVSPAIWESLGTKNVSSMHAQNFGRNKQIMEAEKIY